MLIMEASKIKLIHILAARPNFIKAAPVIKALNKANFYNLIIHTNQHYDYKLSEVFFCQPHPVCMVGKENEVC
jgi:UDP-N-acetylglucosamine 2-epimerase